MQEIIGTDRISTDPSVHKRNPKSCLELAGHYYCDYILYFNPDERVINFKAGISNLSAQLATFGKTEWYA